MPNTIPLPPAPDGLFNRWNLGLRWGMCTHQKCVVRDNLLKCSACQVVPYCSVAHQKAHRPIHKSSCKLVNVARAGLEQEMARLGIRSAEAYAAEHPKEEPPRSFFQHNLNLMDSMLNIKTGDAVEAALAQSLSVLPLDPQDKLCFRSQTAGLFLRLGKDQEAWDFIKWYLTMDYKQDQRGSAFLNIHDQDVFEPFNGYAGTTFDLSFMVCMTNIKCRLLLDLQMLEQEMKKPENADATYDKKMEWVREEALCNAMYKRRDIVERADWTDLIAELRDQIKKMVECVKEQNIYYWPALLVPERWANAFPVPFTFGSKEEVNIVFRNTWYTWAECPAAFEVLKKYTVE